MKACLIGLGGIGYLYDKNEPRRQETHYSALSENRNIRKLICVDTCSKKEDLGFDVFSSLDQLPKNSEFELFVVATPSQSHVSVINELVEFNGAHRVTYVIEKPVGISVEQTETIRQLLTEQACYVNYIRRSSMMGLEIFSCTRLDPLREFRCQFEGSWSNIASHFIDFYLFLTSGDEIRDITFSDGNLTITKHNSHAEFVKSHDFTGRSSPYDFQVLTELYRWEATSGGDIVRKFDRLSSIEISRLESGMHRYQKNFYDRLFDPKERVKLANLSDALVVQKILEKCNETTGN